MSIQFGTWNLDYKPVSPRYLDKVRSLLASYCGDSSSSYEQPGFASLFNAFATTKESRSEKQPHISAAGDIFTWDGCIDNRADLLREFGDGLSQDATDVEIVASAYERWGTGCFRNLLGDWALAIANVQTQSLILAKDFAGVRPLYYYHYNHQMTWSSILEPLVLLAETTFVISEEYVAGWLSSFPAAHLTPYVGVGAVPPSSFLLWRSGNDPTITKYWDFDPQKRIQYGSDQEYQAHFLAVFKEAVRRKLRCDTPILAHLSGGLDSCSIVSVADEVMAEGLGETPRLDTLSYYDDSEPNWNERPYFTKVEKKRGRTGCHIDVSAREPLDLDGRDAPFAVTPGSNSRPNEAMRQFGELITSQGFRVVLSGLGGDEVMGGVPTPIPELEDLIARAQFRTLAHKLKVWALNKRKPWFYLLFEAARGFLPRNTAGENKLFPPWLTEGFTRRNRPALQGYEQRIKLLGPLPTFQENLSTLDMLRRRLACSARPVAPYYQLRYPFLDRELLEFLYAVPRSQLVRPGQRRSLMRRALVGIVPDEILQRRRKAFVSRAPTIALASVYTELSAPGKTLLVETMDIVDSHKFIEALRSAHTRLEVPIVKLMRTLTIEDWLAGLHEQGGLRNSSSQEQPWRFDGRTNPIEYSRVSASLRLHTKERR